MPVTMATRVSTLRGKMPWQVGRNFRASVSFLLVSGVSVFSSDDVYSKASVKAFCHFIIINLATITTYLSVSLPPVVQISSGTSTLFRGAYVSPSDDIKHNQVRFEEIT